MSHGSKTSTILAGNYFNQSEIRIDVSPCNLIKMADQNKNPTTAVGSSEDGGSAEPADDEDRYSENAENIEEVVFGQLCAPPENM